MKTLPYCFAFAVILSLSATGHAFDADYSGNFPGTPPTPSTRFWWDAEKASLRMGGMAGTSTPWVGDEADVGQYSTALGFNNVAKGKFSIALGAETDALSEASVALGKYSTVFQNATGDAEGNVAIGWNAQVAGSYLGNIALGFNVSSIGYQGTVALGNSTIANNESTAMGYWTTAEGIHSTTMGVFTIAKGRNSLAAGFYTTAATQGVTVFGQFNVPEPAGSPDNRNVWALTDELFVVGNGTDVNNPRNAMVIKKNGETTFTSKVRVPASGGLSMGSYQQGFPPL